LTLDKADPSFALEAVANRLSPTRKGETNRPQTALHFDRFENVSRPRFAHRGRFHLSWNFSKIIHPDGTSTELCGPAFNDALSSVNRSATTLIAFSLESVGKIDVTKLGAARRL
jgi:hypothetical protein